MVTDPRNTVPYSFLCYIEFFFAFPSFVGFSCIKLTPSVRCSLLDMTIIYSHQCQQVIKFLECRIPWRLDALSCSWPQIHEHKRINVFLFFYFREKAQVLRYQPCSFFLLFVSPTVKPWSYNIFSLILRETLASTVINISIKKL